MFDTGFVEEIYQALGAAFNNSTTAEYLVCFQKVARVSAIFNVHLIEEISAHMYGSQRKTTVYFYKRNNSSTAAPSNSNSNPNPNPNSQRAPHTEPILANACMWAIRPLSQIFQEVTRVCRKWQHHLASPPASPEATGNEYSYLISSTYTDDSMDISANGDIGDFCSFSSMFDDVRTVDPTFVGISAVTTAEEDIQMTARTVRDLRHSAAKFSILTTQWLLKQLNSKEISPVQLQNGGIIRVFTEQCKSNVI